MEAARPAGISHGARLRRPKQLGDIRDNTPFGTPERNVADQLYNAVKSQIVQQSPAYAKVMQNYATASDHLDELVRGLSLGEKSTTDTALRKLQSVMRDNVNTNYGNRTQLAAELAQHGAPTLMQKLAGQSLSSLAPRGLNRVLASGEAAGLPLLAYFAHPLVTAGAAASLIPQSPRLMGEAAYYAGKVGGLLSHLPGRQQLERAITDDQHSNKRRTDMAKKDFLGAVNEKAKPPVFWERTNKADMAAHKAAVAAGRRAGEKLVRDAMQKRTVPGVDDARTAAVTFGGNAISRPVTPRGGTKTYESNT
jgi:hypothetical protein